MIFLSLGLKSAPCRRKDRLFFDGMNGSVVVAIGKHYSFLLAFSRGCFSVLMSGGIGGSHEMTYHIAFKLQTLDLEVA